MENRQNLSVMFWLKRSKIASDGTAPILCRITIDGDQKGISLNCKAKPAEWDTKSKTITSKTADAKAANLKIAEMEAALTRHFTALQISHQCISSQMLKNSYLGLPLSSGSIVKVATVPKEHQTLLGAFDLYISRFAKMVEKGIRSDETLKHWKSTRKKVADYLIHLKGDNPFFWVPDKSKNDQEDVYLNIEDIDFSFAENFFDYYTIEATETIQEVTVNGHLKKIKQILSNCVKQKWILQNPFAEHSFASETEDIEPLELYEVSRIHKKELTIDRLDKVRDAFIFQCFTGFAFQDLYELGPQHIVKVGVKGERWLIKPRGKTGVNEMVPILPIVEEIIEKYRNDPHCIRNNRLIPVNSNQRYNGYLKELAVICSVNRKLNTHLARHTFADIMLNNGVPLEDVSKMLGHKSIRTTQRYCRVKKIRISKNVAMVRKAIFDKHGKLKLVG